MNHNYIHIKYFLKHSIPMYSERRLQYRTIEFLLKYIQCAQSIPEAKLNETIFYYLIIWLQLKHTKSNKIEDYFIFVIESIVAFKKKCTYAHQAQLRRKPPLKVVSVLNKNTNHAFLKYLNEHHHWLYCTYAKVGPHNEFRSNQCGSIEDKCRAGHIAVRTKFTFDTNRLFRVNYRYYLQ